MQKGLFILDPYSYESIYGTQLVEEISTLVDIYAQQQTADSIRTNLKLLRDVDVVFSGWGAPLMDREFLDAAPGLKAVFYGAGSIRGMVSDAFWERNISITSAYAANAIPVAEYTLSQILFCLKHGWQYALYIKKYGKYPVKSPVPGAYKSVVGIISIGMIGRIVCEYLKNFDIKVIAYDPFIKPEQAEQLNVELCCLEDIFRRSDVVSLHTPWLKETEDMITGAHFDLMKSGAAFINTARGKIVRENEMIEVLSKRTDLTAVLDVTFPEPPEQGSILYTLPNVILTPHIAGSTDGECRRMGSYMLEELKRYLNGEALQWAVTMEKFTLMA